MWCHGTWIHFSHEKHHQRGFGIRTQYIESHRVTEYIEVCTEMEQPKAPSSGKINQSEMSQKLDILCYPINM